MKKRERGERDERERGGRAGTERSYLERERDD